MTPEQEQFVAMLEDANLIPNLLMILDTEDWSEVTVEVNRHGHQYIMTFNPDGKLLNIEEF